MRCVIGWFTDIFSDVGDFIEETFIPEGVKDTISDIPVVGDAISRGWLGPTIQQFTDEGKEAEAKGTGTAGMVEGATEAAIMAALAMAIPGAFGAGGGIFGSGATLPGFGGGAGTQLFSSLGLPGFGAGGMFNPTTGGAMDFASLLSRTPGINTQTGAIDWGALTGQSSALGSSPLDLFTGGGGLNSSNIINLLSTLGGGGGNGNILNTVLQQVMGGGGGGGGGQPTGTQQNQNWLNQLLNTLSGGGGGGQQSNWLNDLLKIGSTAWGGLEAGREAERQRDWLENLYAPQREYQQEQLGLFKDVFSPMTKSLGGQLGKEFSLEDTGEAYFTKGRNRLEDYFKDIEQRSSEVFAGSGMLGQGPTNKYFTEELPAMKAKSMEELAVDEVLFKEGLNQQNISNQLSFLGRSPSVASYGTPAYTSTNINWGNLLKDIVSPTTSPVMV